MGEAAAEGGAASGAIAWDRQRWGGVCGLVYAVLWLAAGVMTGIGVDFEINATPELLRVVSSGDRRVIFVAANIVGAFGQLALPGFLVGLGDHVDRRRPTVVMGLTYWFVAAILTIVSCGFHAVFGHIPAQVVRETGRTTPSLVREADVLHHLGDFFYNAGVLAIVAALIFLLPALRGLGRAGPAIAVIGWIGVVTAVLQFAWLVGIDPLENFGVVGILAQIAVVVMLSMRMLRITDRRPARP